MRGAASILVICADSSLRPAIDIQSPYYTAKKYPTQPGFSDSAPCFTEVLIIVGETGSGKTTQIPPGASQVGSAGVRFRV